MHFILQDDVGNEHVFRLKPYKRRTNNFVRLLLTFLSNKMEEGTYTPYFIVAFVVISFENKFDIPSHGCNPINVKIIYTLGKKQMTIFEKNLFTEMVSVKRLLKRDITQPAFTYTVFSKLTPPSKCHFRVIFGVFISFRDLFLNKI